MKKLGLVLVTAFAYHTPTQPTTADRARWQAHANNVPITRDDWAILHVRGKTDAYPNQHQLKVHTERVYSAGN